MEAKTLMDRNRNLWDTFIEGVGYISLGCFFYEECSFQENDLFFDVVTFY